MDEEKELLEFEALLNTNFYELNDFTFISGERLNNLTIEYSTIGTPIQNENSEIINGILYFHGWSGDSKSIRRLHEIIGENKIFDINKFFFICISTLGSPKSSSPSSTGLKNKFPNYTILDMVNFQKKFLAEKFNITHLKGIIGNSMGGFETLTWGCEYPLDMDFLISIVSSYQVAGHNYSLFKIMNDIIMADSEYNDGNYNNSLKNLPVAYESMGPFGLSWEFYRKHQTNEELNQSLNEMQEEAKDLDGNDLIYRNNACLNYDIEDKLNKIIAKTLIVAINQDCYFPPDLDAIPMSKLLKNSNLIIYDSLFGHVGSHEIIKIEKDLKNFLKPFL